jgi:hypothetical protein
VNKDGLGDFDRFLDKFKNSVGRLIFRIEQHLHRETVLFRSKVAYLIVLIKPEKGQVGNADRFPVVLDLRTRTVNDVRHFIGHHEFEILNGLAMKTACANLQLMKARPL